MSTRFAQRLGLAVAVGVAALLAGAGAGAPASAAPGAPDGQGWVRFGHFAPSVSGVDVYLDGEVFAAAVDFKGVSEYEPVTSGVHRFELKPAGDPAAASLLTVDAGVPAGGAVTVGAVTARDGVASQVYDDALQAPEPGQASVRFIHAAPDVAAVDVQVIGGPLLATGVPYPLASGYQAIEPGQYDVEIRPTGTTDVSLRVAGWAIAPGVQSSIIIVRGLDGQLDVVPVRDSASVVVAPVGGVQTGFGGMAGARSSNGSSSATLPILALALAAGGSLSAVGGIRARRRR